MTEAADKLSYAVTGYFVEGRLAKLEAVAEAATHAIDNTAHPIDCVVDGRLLCTCWQQDVRSKLADLEAE